MGEIQELVDHTSSGEYVKALRKQWCAGGCDVLRFGSVECLGVLSVFAPPNHLVKHLIKRFRDSITPF